ncbi:glycosyltransferase family 4 protein [Uliginosibacterium sp. sgz301328]|uniref:glycosyltransferase family 4 protein n=1 Tax=Uliginosibacterium sp. sgz301328 TaxID=3243764 RepID=UPI00359E6C1B
MDATRISVLDLASRHRQMRIAVVTETYPPEVNGVAMTTGRLIAGLQELGHAVQLVRPRQGSDDSPAQGEDFNEMLARGIPIPRYNHLKMGLPARNALVRAWSLRRPDIVQVVTEGPLGWSAVAAARRLKLPVITEFHTNFHAYSRYYGIGWLKQSVAAYLRRFHNKGDLTLVPTPALRDELLAAGFHHVDVVARGVDTGLFCPARRSDALRQSWGATPETLVCAIVSRLAPEKNLDLAIRAFESVRARHRNSRLVLVGDGPARAGLQARYPEHVFAGMQRGEDLAAHYASADCFIFPSLTETFGNVIAEALASGLPVVSFDYAAASELITTGSNGLVVPFGDEAAFISACELLVQDRALLGAMRAAAQDSVRHLDWLTVAAQLVRLLDETVSSHEIRQQTRSSLLAQPD